MNFENKIIDNVVQNLLNGKDYRSEILNVMNARFFDFSLDFFKKIVIAKMSNGSINLEWYRNYFINGNYKPDESAIFAGINKKTITNIYGSATKSIVLDVANANFTYLSNMVNQLEEDVSSGLDVVLSLSYNDITVRLTLSESLIVVNALATKKLQMKGSVWSSIGKQVEKPLIDKMCDLLKVPLNNRNPNFVYDSSKSFDREYDYKLVSNSNKTYKIELKLVGKGNPENSDAAFARDTQLLIADTLSIQSKNQLKSEGIQFVELHNNPNSLLDFYNILQSFDIPSFFN